MAPDLALQSASDIDAPISDDEAFCRLALRDDIPPLGLTLDELLRRARPERWAA